VTNSNFAGHQISNNGSCLFQYSTVSHNSQGRQSHNACLANPQYLRVHCLVLSPRQASCHALHHAERGAAWVPMVSAMKPGIFELPLMSVNDTAPASTGSYQDQGRYTLELLPTRVLARLHPNIAEDYDKHSSPPPLLPPLQIKTSLHLIVSSSLYNVNIFNWLGGLTMGEDTSCANVQWDMHL